MSDMPVEITDKGDYVLFEFSSQFSQNAGRNCVDIMGNACQQYGRSKVLLDCSRMTGSLSVMDRFTVIQYGTDVLRQIHAIALVGRKEDMMGDNFAENVAINRGLELRVFSDMQEAVAWLAAASKDSVEETS